MHICIYMYTHTCICIMHIDIYIYLYNRQIDRQIDRYPYQRVDAWCCPRTREVCAQRVVRLRVNPIYIYIYIYIYANLYTSVHTHTHIYILTSASTQLVARARARSARSVLSVSPWTRMCTAGAPRKMAAMPSRIETLDECSSTQMRERWIYLLGLTLDERERRMLLSLSLYIYRYLQKDGGDAFKDGNVGRMFDNLNKREIKMRLFICMSVYLGPYIYIRIVYLSIHIYLRMAAIPSRIDTLDECSSTWKREMRMRLFIEMRMRLFICLSVYLSISI